MTKSYVCCVQNVYQDWPDAKPEDKINQHYTGTDPVELENNVHRRYKSFCHLNWHKPVELGEFPLADNGKLILEKPIPCPKCGQEIT